MKGLVEIVFIVASVIMIIVVFGYMVWVFNPKYPKRADNLRKKMLGN